MTADGVVQLVSAAAPGAVRIADATDDASRRGTVRVTQQVPEGGHPNFAVIDVSGPAGSGAIRIRGGQVNLDTVQIFLNNLGIQASTGGIDVEADALEMRSGTITVDVLNAGRGGAITIQAGDVTLTDTAMIRSIVSSSGDAGAVRIEAGRLRVIGPRDATAPTGISITTATGSSGDSGSIMIKAGVVEIRGTGIVVAPSQGAGNAGTIGMPGRYDAS